MDHTFRRLMAAALCATLATAPFPALPIALADTTAETTAGTASSATTATAAETAATTTEATGSETATAQLNNAKTVSDAITALPKLSDATHADASSIKRTHTLYNELTETEKAQVSASKTKKLTTLYDALSAAEKVAAEIGELPTASSAKKADYAGIAKVAKRYEALAQKAFVKQSLANKIEALEELVYYESAPVLTYQVKAPGKNKATTVADDKAHSVKGGLGQIKVSLPKSGYDGKTELSGSISYGVKIAGKKASAAKSSKWVGSSSKKNTVQAFKLKFGGMIASHYTAYYRVKTGKLGWGNWATGGAWAGSTGMNLRITGLQVKFVQKGAKAPGETTSPLLGKSSLSYRVRSVKGGWGSYKKAGATAGTESWKAGIEQVQLKTTGDLDGKASVSVLTRKGSWTSYGTGPMGSASKAKQAQAVRIKLTGSLAKVYDVYYRVYASDHHWLGWAKNGQKAGTQGHRYSMGALQVKLVLKGQGAPGSTAKHFTTKAVPYSSGGQLTMTRKAQKYSSSTGWLVLVNRNTTHVGVFRGSKGSWNLERYILCDVGASSTPTPRGTRHVQYRIPSFGEEKGYSVYKATNIGGGYFFHSILYYANTRNVMDGTLGAWCSHGCIRMSYNNAKYIYDHVSNATTVVIY